ncbi:hypothetical protein LJC33_04935 [Eubacteriales bacterium OttesenSCG-928-N13]|nr:hypothetical protein [Eubacteriales bacterium OttesenSCG-928-N13]
MKRRSIKIIAVFLAILLGLVSAVALALDVFMANAEGAQPDGYQMNIELLDELEAIRVEQTVHYTNRTGQALGAVMFNLYANAYRRQVTTPFELESMQSAYPEGFTPGGVDFFLIEVDGKAADWGVQGDSEAFLRVACDLEPGQVAQFRFGYEVLIPRCRGIFGVTELGWQLNLFYPIVAPWDDTLKEFSLAQISPIGRNVYADPANYQATVYVPNGCQLASVGQIEKQAHSEQLDAWTITAEGVRELPLFVSRNYLHHEQKSQHVMLHSYMQDGGNANLALNYGLDALDIYAELLGEPATSTISIVQMDAVQRSASTSGVVALNADMMGWDQRDEMEYQIVFNLAKQYFGEVVGYHPAREPWLGESIPAYMALQYYQRKYGRDRFLTELNARVLPALKLTMPGGVKVDSEVAQFASVSEYETVMHERGAGSLYELSVTTGESTLLNALKLYLTQYRGQQASLPDFSAALNQASGRELDYLVLEMLQNIEDYIAPNTEWYE